MTDVVEGASGVASETGALLHPEDLPWIDYTSERFRTEPWAVFREVDSPIGMCRSDRGIEVFTYDGIMSLFQNKELFLGFNEVYEAMGISAGRAFEASMNSLSNIEGDHHQAVRSTFGRYFSPRRSEKLRSKIAEIAREILDGIEPGAEIDVLADVLAKVPSTLFTEIVGIPRSDAPFLARNSDVLVEVFLMSEVSAERVEEAMGELLDYTHALIERKLKEPGDDLVSYLLEAEAEGKIDRDDVVNNTVAALRASTDTTSTQMAMSLITLIEQPGAWEYLRENPSQIPAVILETIRWSSAAWSILRVARTGGIVDGLEVEPGTHFYGLAMVGHRDPDAFDDPDEFQLDRVPAKLTLNWGAGRHYCLGRQLALVETEEVLKLLITSWPSVEITRPVEILGLPWFSKPSAIWVRPSVA